MTNQCLVVLSSPVSGREAEFESWYDEVHLRDIAAIDGVVSARRMRVLDIQPDGFEVPVWRSLAIYEFNADAEEVIGQIAKHKASGAMQISTALDRNGLVKMLVADTQSTEQDHGAG